MNVLLVNPEFPDSFWSMKHSLRFSRARWAFPPLGLATVAALLPQHWTFRLVDLNVEALPDEALRQADVVMLTGMLVQRPSLHHVLARCRAPGVRTVVGGPYATALPHELSDADVVVVGELEEIASELAADLEAGRPRPVYREAGKPELARSPVPRFDLLDPDAYYIAGFAGVFVGIETPSPEALRETRKLQNLRGDLVAQVHALQAHGLDVAGGFILGFDHDGPDSFDRMIRFVRESAIATAMVGLLGALPNTPLYRRLEREGRLRPEIPGDQFGLTNVVTTLPAEILVAGYARVLRALFDPEAYFERARDNLRRLRRPAPRPLARRDLAAAARAIWARAWPAATAAPTGASSPGRSCTARASSHAPWRWRPSGTTRSPTPATW